MILTLMIAADAKLVAIERATQLANANGIPFAADIRGMLMTVGPGPQLGAFLAELYRSGLATVTGEA